MSIEKLDDLLEQVWYMPDGDEKIALLLEAVQLADSLGEVEQAFEIRHDLMEAANAWGRPEHELVAFAWCLAKLDADPETFDEWQHSILWTYKRVLSTLWSFPHISTTQIESALADFKKRLEATQNSLGTYHEFALRYALHLGDAARIEAEYSAWRKFSPQDLDCQACWLHLEVQYNIWHEKYAEAIAKAERLFSRRAPSCNRVPHVTHASILEPLLRLNDFAATKVHHHAFRKIAKDEAFLRVASINLAYLAYANNVLEATKFLEKHLPWAFRTLNLESRFESLRDTLPLFARFKQYGIGQINLQWDKENPLYQGQTEHQVVALEAAVLEHMKTIAAQFDSRNQSSRFGQRIGFDADLLRQFDSLTHEALEEPILETSKSNRAKQKNAKN